MADALPTPLRTRPRQTRSETRRQVLDAALVFLEERPLGDLTVEELMAVTGHSRTVFYRHFADLSELVLALMEEIADELHVVAERWTQTPGDPVAASAAGLAGIVETFSRRAPVMRAIVFASHTDPEVGRAYAELNERFVTLTADALAHAEARGIIPKLGVDHHEVAIALNAMNVSYLIDRLGTRPPASPEGVLAVLQTLWARVLAPQVPTKPRSTR